MSATLRCTVQSMHYSACGLHVGDWFELGPAGVSAPGGFCWFAIASLLPLLEARRADDTGLAAWLASEPIVACPDPPEALHLRIALVV